MDVSDAFGPDDHASFGQRLVAFAIDLVVTAIVTFVVLIGLTIANDGRLSLEGFGLVVTWVATSLVWDTACIAGPLRAKPGQLLAGFRVVQPDGARVPVTRAAIRAAVRLGTFVFLFVGLIAQAIAIAASPRNQAIHDAIATTVCVKADALRRIGSVQHVPTASQLEAPATSPVQGPDEQRHRGPFL